MHFCCFLMNFEMIYRYFPHPQTNDISLTWRSKLYWLWFNIIDWYLAFVPKMFFLSSCFNLDVSNDIYLYEVCVLLCICHIYDIYYIVILQTIPYMTILPPPLYIFLSNPSLLITFFWRNHPNEICNKHKYKLIWQSLEDEKINFYKQQQVEIWPEIIAISSMKRSQI